MVSGQLKKKYVTSMSYKLEPAIWSHDTGVVIVTGLPV